MAPQTLNTTRDVHQPLTQDARGGGNIAGGAHITEGNTKLLPLLLTIALLSGVALGVAVMAMVFQNQSAMMMILVQNQSEARNLEKNSETTRHVAELQARIVSAEEVVQMAGLNKPGDQKYGPGANPNRLKEHH